MKKERTCEIKLTSDEAEILDLQVFDVIAGWKYSPEFGDLKALARSCYLQGLVDGSNPHVGRVLSALKAADSPATGEGE